MSLFRIAFVTLVVATSLSCKQQAPTETTTAPAASAHEGQAFTEAPVVDIATLVADPAGYKGKTVRLSGDVIAMCHHKRDWFALVPEGTKTGNVRVLTGPVFKVPQDAIGKSASAEGTVDVVEISERVAKHFAETHKLGDPATISGPVQQVVVRATGAQFN
jgi:hypothetical protein